MKYKNTHFDDYYLVKYSIWFNGILDDLENKNSIFTSYVKKWPSYMDENSQMQSYMIIDNTHTCCGEMFMYPSTANNNDMNINVLVDDNRLNVQQSYDLINKLVNFLGTKLNSKEKFIINIYNNIDLAKYDKSQYTKLYNTINHTSFSFDNLINKNKATLIEGTDGRWYEYKRSNDNYHYMFKFDKNSNFTSQIYDKNDNSVKIEHLGSYDEVQINNQNGILKLVNSIVSKDKVMRYISPKEKHCSTAITLYFNNNKIKKCYVDFRLHKNCQDPNKGKIKGNYYLRIDTEYNIFRLFYITRNGLLYSYSLSDLASADKNIYSIINQGILSKENVNEIITLVQDYINQNSFNNNKIYRDNSNICQTIFDMEKEAYSILKQVNNNSVPYLKDSIDNYLLNQEQLLDNKSNQKIKIS